ncbi:hypothetical protein QNM99_18305 [Pseudomonas sp. PCH446]
MAKANDGYYPLGSNGLWHGGVHFDESTGLVAQQSEVRCIADGQVIAYRIDEAYPVSAYSDRSTIASTGFVLVKHQLEVPAPPAPPTPATAAGATPARLPQAGRHWCSIASTCTCWTWLATMQRLHWPSAYWGGDTYQVSASANDKVLGLNVHAAQKNTQGYEQILATLPQGTTVTTGEASANGQWLKIVSVSPEMSGLAADTGWIYKANMNSLGNNQYLIGKKGDDVPATQVKGLNVHKTAATSGPSCPCCRPAHRSRSAKRAPAANTANWSRSSAVPRFRRSPPTPPAACRVLFGCLRWRPGASPRPWAAWWCSTHPSPSKPEPWSATRASTRITMKAAHVTWSTWRSSAATTWRPLSRKAVARRMLCRPTRKI